MKTFYKIAIAIIIYAMLSIPDPYNPLPIKDVEESSTISKWWGKYAQNLVKYRIINNASRAYYYDLHRSMLNQKLDNMELELTEPDSPMLDSISYHINKLSALASLVPNKINEFEGDVFRWRRLLKYQSRYWDISSKSAGNRLYQLMVESRLAFESALVQSNYPTVAWSTAFADGGFQTKIVKSITFQSGDILAFNLQRENNLGLSFRRDMPNAYDHLGSVYIQGTEAYVTYVDHELGLQSYPLDTFVSSLAPNGMILRVRQDIQPMIENPELPIMVAASLFGMAQEGKYKFDFRYDLETRNYLYDWEMLNNLFKKYDLTIGPEKIRFNTHTINLGPSKINHEPFEMEYDPKLIVAGEWYETKTLYDQRVLTAATSTLILSNNEAGFVNPWKLPMYRVIKAYSMILNQFGANGPIPKGVSAQTHMVRVALVKQQKKALTELKKELAKYESEQNHKATYLKMLQSAKEINYE